MNNFQSSKQTNQRPQNLPERAIKRAVHSLYILSLPSVDRGRLEVIELKLIPDGVSESYKQQIVTQQLYGTYSPMYFYTGGGSKTIQFRFTIHEDINHVEGSIYKLRDKLISFGTATFDATGTLQEPLVYLELGDQFAGKGFLSTTFGFKTPYRNGRMIVADVEMTFTFIEEFDQDTYQLSTAGEHNYIRREDLTVDLKQITGGYSAISDLYEGLDSNDLQVLKDFAFEKATTDILNTTDSLGNQSFYIAKNPELLAHYATLNGVSDFTKYKHEVAGDAYNYWLDYTIIIHSVVYSVPLKIKNLKTLKEKIYNYLNWRSNKRQEWDYNEEFKDLDQATYWALALLVKNIDAQLQLYSLMGGASL